MEIGQAGFGGDRGASETTGLMNNLLANTILASREINVFFAYRASIQLVGLSVMGLVVTRLPITHHSHDKRKRSTRAVIFVGIEKDTKSLEVIFRTEHWALCCALLGEP